MFFRLKPLKGKTDGKTFNRVKDQGLTIAAI